MERKFSSRGRTVVASRKISSVHIGFHVADTLSPTEVKSGAPWKYMLEFSLSPSEVLAQLARPTATYLNGC